MALFGLFKSQRERKAEQYLAYAETTEFKEIFEELSELRAALQLEISLVETFPDETRKRAAQLSVDAVMRMPVTLQTIVWIKNKMDNEVDKASPICMGHSIALDFLLALSKLNYIPEPIPFPVELLLARMEGTLLGFIQRAHVPGWQPSYTESSNGFGAAFEASRHRYVAEHPAV